ncbi:749_t:CDS:2, partial [Acaulospora colombiana]
PQFAKRSPPERSLPAVGNFVTSTTTDISQTQQRPNRHENRSSQLNHAAFETGSRRFMPPSRINSDSVTYKPHTSTSSETIRNVPQFTPQKRVPMGPPPLPKKVEWHSASALDPESYKSLVSSSNAIVHTLGTLLETEGYKRSVQRSDPFGVTAASVKALRDNLQGENPLNKASKGSYLNVNRDTADQSASKSPRTFVYISAEDVFRPAIPSGYISSKREAEKALMELCSQATPPVRSISIRPTPIATALEVMGGIHSTLGVLSPISILSNITKPHKSNGQENEQLDGHIQSIERAATIPPIHVDHVGEAVCEAIAREEVSGPVGVREMRKLLGWADGAETGDSSFANS